MSVLSNRKSDAAADAGAYIAAILDLLGDREPISVLQETPEAVRGMLHGRPDDLLRRPEAPGKWSAVEVVQHLADSDLVWAYRMRLVIAEDRPALTGFDQDLWATRLRYGEVEVAAALWQFDTIRALNLQLITNLDARDLERVGVHTERGDERLDHMIRLYAGHDLAHLRQLRRILEA